MGKKENAVLATYRVIRPVAAEFSKKVITARTRLLIERDRPVVEIFPHLSSFKLFYLSHSARMYPDISNNVFYKVNFNPFFAFYSNSSSDQRYKIYQQNIDINWNKTSHLTAFTYNIPQNIKITQIVNNTTAKYIQQYFATTMADKTDNNYILTNNSYSFSYPSRKYFTSTNHAGTNILQGGQRPRNMDKSGSNSYSFLYPTTNNILPDSLQQSKNLANTVNNTAMSDSYSFSYLLWKYFSHSGKANNNQYHNIPLSISTKEIVFNTSKNVDNQKINTIQLVHKTAMAVEHNLSQDYRNAAFQKTPLTYYDSSMAVPAKALPEQVNNQAVTQAVILPDNGSKRHIAPQDIDMNSLFNDLYSRLETKLKVERERRGIF